MSVKMRQEVERKIAKALVKSALDAGYAISVDNGADDDVILGVFSDAKIILSEMFATDEDRLYLWKDGKRFGWVLFIYGNDGWDVISDYTVNLEHIMADANKISAHYEG